MAIASSSRKLRKIKDVKLVLGTATIENRLNLNIEELQQTIA